MIFHQASLAVFLAALLLIALSNLRLLRRLDRPAGQSPQPPEAALPRVSILVPARNEEANIEACVSSLLAQDYPHYEVLVLDDHSQDRTGELLQKLAGHDRRLKVLQGEPLPEGWLGKHWACQQLAAAAQGELYLFTDADTRHHPDTIMDAVTALLDKKAAFLSVWPRQKVVSWGERLTVPLIYWSFFSFLPLALARRTRIPAFSAAIGQFMLFRREAYERTGGHAAVRDQPADDLALARRVKASGLTGLLLDGSRRIECRMYSGFKQAAEGLSKNLLAAFDHRILPFVFVWTWIGIVFLEPLLITGTSLLGGELRGVSLPLAYAAIAQAWGLWAASMWRFRFPWWIPFLYPVIVSLGVLLAGRSLMLSLSGRASWKGRRLGRPEVRWW